MPSQKQVSIHKEENKLSKKGVLRRVTISKGNSYPQSV